MSIPDSSPQPRGTAQDVAARMEEPMTQERVLTDDQGDPLHERLHTLEEEIRERVHAVCEHATPEDLDTGELIRFEEDLSIATAAAKEAVSLRRRLRSDESAKPVERPVSSDRPGTDASRDSERGAIG